MSPKAKVGLAALGAGGAWLAIWLALIIGGLDVFIFVGVLILVPAMLLTSVALAVYAAFRKRSQLLPIAAMLAFFWAVPACFYWYDHEYPFALRESARWLVSASEYKQQALAQPAPSNGGLRHIEWDGSGFAGVANNTVYLVFDPTDRLSSAVTTRVLEKSDGVYCHVWSVHRLESHWYWVLYFTDQDWENCT